MRQYRTVLGEGSQDGAYGYEYRIQVYRTRRGNYYGEVSGFRWRGNEGGRATIRYRLRNEDDAVTIVSYIDAAQDPDSIVCLYHAQDKMDAICEWSREVK